MLGYRTPKLREQTKNFKTQKTIKTKSKEYSRPYGQCRRAAFMKHRYLQFNKVSAVSVVVLAGAVVVSVAVVVVASFKQLCVTAGSGEPAVT